MCIHHHAVIRDIVFLRLYHYLVSGVSMKRTMSIALTYIFANAEKMQVDLFCKLSAIKQGYIPGTV
jgi:hypothetical protein